MSEVSSKYIYCPDYDRFFCNSKQILQERLINHSHIREGEIRHAVQNTVSEIMRLGFTIMMKQTIPKYTKSFINYARITQHINRWSGPMISAQYKEKFHLHEAGTMNVNKFNKDAVNWLDQSSYKVSGSLFAEHMAAIKHYFSIICKKLHLSKQSRKHVLNYCCIYCIQQLLSIKTKFTRSKKQPLIRYTTLRDSDALHVACKKLYKSLDLTTFKKTVKTNNKNDPTINLQKRYRVDSNAFAENVRIYVANLVRKEWNILHEKEGNDEDALLPEYFMENNNAEQSSKKRKKKRNHNNTTTNNNNNNNTNNTNNTNNRRNVIYPPPKPAPPATDCSAKRVHKCCCEHKHAIRARTIYVPVPIRIPYAVAAAVVPPNNNMNYTDPLFSYQHVRGAQYMGSAAQLRAHPYRVAEEMIPAAALPPVIKPEHRNINSSIAPIASPFSDWQNMPDPMIQSSDTFSFDTRSIAEDTASLCPSLPLFLPTSSSSVDLNNLI